MKGEDFKKLRKGVKVKDKTGAKHTLKGVYLSPQGLILMVEYGPGSIVNRHIPVDFIEEVEE